MRHRIYAHLVWTTRDRKCLIDLRVAKFLDRFLRDVARQERALVLEAGIVQNHVHLLIRQHPTTNIPQLLQRLKGGSAIVADQERHATVALRWARGYTIDSISRHNLADARAYVRDQPGRHPALVIPGWRPADPVSSAREEEWIGENRTWIVPRRRS
ncbi:MAG TPA: IS200/IS605 family transposase [Gemmatimonadales bacterium]|nr:IS200/IS605 family transposase [Gemmatimonadales bacterium]